MSEEGFLLFMGIGFGAIIGFFFGLMAAESKER